MHGEKLTLAAALQKRSIEFAFTYCETQIRPFLPSVNMRTSRISKETAKIVAALSPSKSSPRQTRSSVTLNRAFPATSSIEPLNGIHPIADGEEDSDDSSLSSAPSVASFDIEDHFSPPKKRKRDLDSPATTVTVSTAIRSTRPSSRKAAPKQEDGDEPPKAKKTRRQPARKITNEAGEIEIHPPSNWEEMYECVREMRKTHLAPVDTMGCERIAEEHRDPKASSPFHSPREKKKQKNTQ